MRVQKKLKFLFLDFYLNCLNQQVSKDRQAITVLSRNGKHHMVPKLEVSFNQDFKNVLKLY